MIDIRDHGIGVGGGSNIKSIQRGAMLLTNSFVLDKVINPVDINNSIVLVFVGSNGSDRSPKFLWFTAKLMDSTTLQLRSTSSGYAEPYGKLYWQVIEFNNVKSIQRGSITSAANTSIPISPINVEKSMLLHSFSSGSTTLESLPFIEIVDSTTLNAMYRGKLEWQLIEFK